MTPRERVLAAADHREPDRVPLDLGATPSSGISAVAYGSLTRHLGLRGSVNRVYDVVQQLAQPEDAVLDRFGVDVIDLGRAFNTGPGAWRGTTLGDGSPAQYPEWFRPARQPDGSWHAHHADGTHIATMPADGWFFEQACHPYVDGYPESYDDLPAAMSKVMWAAMAHSPWDHAAEPDFWRTLRARAIEMRASTDRAILVVCGCNLLEWGMFLRRIDNFLMDLLTDPDRAEGLLDALMEIHLGTLARVCEAVGDVADIVRFGDDLGMDTGPFMDPKIYRRLFKPRHTALCGFAHRHSGMRTFLHSCGSIYAIMPDLIEAGFEIINPVQTACKDMEPERLKREFGADVTFWGGGCDTRTVLNRATPARVREHVRRRLEIFAPGGGFVFNTVHNILPDVPPENILAMYEALDEFNA